MPNLQEVLVYALLLLHSGRKAADLGFWAGQVLEEEKRAEEMGAAWQPPATSGWTPPKGKVAPLWDVLRHDLLERSWSGDELERIASVMRAWDGPGHYDGPHPIVGDHVRRYLTQLKAGQLKGPGAKHPPLRWKTGAVCKVAAIVKRRGVELRKLLQGDEVEEVPMATERLKAAMEQIAALEAERDKLADNYRKKCDAHRKLLDKSAGKRTTVTEAKEELRARHKEELKELKAQHKEELKEAKVEAMDESMEFAQAHMGYMLEKERKEKCTAQARARDAEAETKKKERKLARVENKVAELQAEPEPDSSDADESDESNESEDETARTLDFEVLPRRDERGRWQAESSEVRALRYAQLARGISASHVSANIQDVVDLLEPGLELPASCDRMNRIMRGEVTLAGEAMAAYKLAACKKEPTRSARTRTPISARWAATERTTASRISLPLPISSCALTAASAPLTHQASCSSGARTTSRGRCGW